MTAPKKRITVTISGPDDWGHDLVNDFLAVITDDPEIVAKVRWIPKDES